jgi:hypothetical protein
LEQTYPTNVFLLLFNGHIFGATRDRGSPRASLAVLPCLIDLPLPRYGHVVLEKEIS